MAVVHAAHGIGIFEGIVKQEVGGVTKDYIKIRYAGTDMLYVPVTQLDLVTRYIGGRDEQTVKLKIRNGRLSAVRDHLGREVKLSPENSVLTFSASPGILYFSGVEL